MNRDVTLQRRLVVYGPGLLIFALFQLRVSLNRGFPAPDFLLLFPAVASLWTPGYDGFILGLVAGFIRDYAAGRGYGLGMLTGMILGLLGNAVARGGWRHYALWGSLLILSSTVIHEWMMALLAWLIPLDLRFSSLSTAMKVSSSHIPLKLLANMAGALMMTGCLFLAFYKRQTGGGGPDLTEVAKEVSDD